MRTNSSLIFISLEIRPHYTWQPSELLNQVMHFDESLFTATALSDDSRKDIIERYPGMRKVDYQTPDTVPVAARKMNTPTKPNRIDL